MLQKDYRDYQRKLFISFVYLIDFWCLLILGEKQQFVCSLNLIAQTMRITLIKLFVHSKLILIIGCEKLLFDYIGVGILLVSFQVFVLSVYLQIK